MKEILNFLVLLLFILAMICQVTLGQSRASYGEPCDRGTRCDSRASLSCSANGTCDCVKVSEMTYDLAREKCVVLSGERCSYTAIEVLMDTTKEKRWTERLDCVENAICKEDGYCGCKTEFFEDSKGFCQMKRTHGGNCTQDEECREDKHLKCDMATGVCSCDEKESIWDTGYGQCLAKVGSSCVKYGMCVRNAYCQRPRRLGGSREWELCQCSTDYRKSKDGLCLGNYGVYCDSMSSPCSEDLTCINGQCGCHFPLHQEYNRTLGECVSAVRGPCKEFRENAIPFEYRCSENAECRNDTGLNECLCKKGFIESDLRRCRLAFGAPCKHNDVCDKVADLQCVNGKCACKDLQWYDDLQRTCRGKVGAVCEMKHKDFCVDGAECNAYRDEGMGKGVCQCQQGYEVGYDRKCSKLMAMEQTMEDTGFENGIGSDWGTTEETVFIEEDNKTNS